VVAVEAFERTVVAAVACAMVAVTVGCKREPERPEERGVSWRDITVGYPGLEEQKRRIEKYSDLIDQEAATEKPDETIRKMMEDVPLEHIEMHLQQLAEESWAQGRPNIRILLDRIKKIRGFDERRASEFIRKAKEERNVNGLSVSLFGLRTEDLRAKAADTLAELKDPNAARLLTISLYQAAGLHSGGSEGQVMREQFRSSLATALASCTGLDFSDYDPSSETATLEMVKECEDWLEKTGR
jgi:hypothetical protein